MHKRQLTIVGIILTAATILFAITTYRQQAQDKVTPQNDEATVVYKGQITEKQRHYSKEYKTLYSYRKGNKLTELSESGKRRGNRKEIGVSLGIPLIPTVGGSVITGSEFVNNLACKANAVVIGSVKSKIAHLTEDETFVYTEYEFSVSDVLKNNSASPVEINKTIQITRPGGLIKLDDQIIRVVDQLYEQLETNKEYLLFLNFIPDANGYVVSSAEGDFVLANGSFRTLSKLRVPEELMNENKSLRLINSLRNSTQFDCNKKSIGGN
jgi:hypothetical protein